MSTTPRPSPFKISLEIPWVPAALNQSLRTHRFKNYSTNKSWDVYIASHLVGKKPEKPLERAHLTLIRHAHRMLDYDGLVGSMKPVVDALVTAGVIRDDSWKVLGRWDVDQKFRPKAIGQRLEIHVEEIPGPAGPVK